MVCYFVSAILVWVYLIANNAPVEYLIAAGLFAIAGAMGWRNMTKK